MADVFPEVGCAMVIMTVMMEVMKTGIDVQDLISRRNGQRHINQPTHLVITGSSAAEVVNVLIDTTYAMVDMTVMMEVTKFTAPIHQKRIQHRCGMLQ